VKSVWSVALSWDVKSRLTHGTFDGASDVDYDLLLGSLNAAPLHHLSHPFLIPCLLLDQLEVYYSKNWRAIGREAFLVERRLGLTRGRHRANPWAWNQDRFRLITYDLMTVTTALVYIERRLTFAMSMAKSLAKNISTIDLQLHEDAQRKRASEHFKEKLGNSIASFENQLHQVSCLQKRSTAFTNTVSTYDVN
jgi:hypothetical protein